MDLFSELFNEIWHDFDMFAAQPARETQVRCKVCGHTLSDFRKSGKLGCGECYNTFRPTVEATLKQIHSNSVHQGKIPSKSGAELRKKRELESLKKQLNEAVKAENYELAAKLHREIKNLSE